MEAVYQVLQNSLSAMAGKLALLVLLMSVFAIITFILLAKVRINGKFKSQIAAFCSLAGFYIWIKYFLV